MALLLAACVEFRDGRRRAAVRRHAKEPARRLGREHDHVGSVPGPAAPERRVADDLRRAAGRRDGLELLVGEETDPRAVGRPERLRDAIATLDPPRVRRVQMPHPELALGRDVTADDERDHAAVRRDGHVRRVRVQAELPAVAGSTGETRRVVGSGAFRRCTMRMAAMTRAVRARLHASASRQPAAGAFGPQPSRRRRRARSRRGRSALRRCRAGDASDRRPGSVRAAVATAAACGRQLLPVDLFAQHGGETSATPPPPNARSPVSIS